MILEQSELDRAARALHTAVQAVLHTGLALHQGDTVSAKSFNGQANEAAQRALIQLRASGAQVPDMPALKLPALRSATIEEELSDEQAVQALAILDDLDASIQRVEARLDRMNRLVQDMTEDIRAAHGQDKAWEKAPA